MYKTALAKRAAGAYNTGRNDREGKECDRYDVEQLHHGRSGRHDLCGLGLAAQRSVTIPHTKEPRHTGAVAICFLWEHFLPQIYKNRPSLAGDGRFFRWI